MPNNKKNNFLPNCGRIGEHTLVNYSQHNSSQLQSNGKFITGMGFKNNCKRNGKSNCNQLQRLIKIQVRGFYQKIIKVN